MTSRAWTAILFGHAGVRQHHRIGALVIEQRRATEIVEGHYLADQDDVVATIDLLVQLALETCGAIGKQRRTTDAPVERHALELVIARAGELVG
ncbi:hypothetical protein D3C72_2227260 [compost metagenome]